MNQRLNLDLAWAAGFYEGEGSVSCCGGTHLVLVVGQVDREPLERFALAMGEGHISGPKRQKSPLSKKPFFAFQANGEAVLRCARLLWANLSNRRKDQFLLALIRWSFRSVRNRQGVRRDAIDPTAWSERLHGIREYVPAPFNLKPGEYEPALET